MFNQIYIYIYIYTSIYIYIYIYFHIYIYIYIYMEVNKEINLTVWRKVEKTNNLKFDEFIKFWIIVFFTFSSYIYHHDHDHDMRLAWISLTLSLHVSLSFIAFGRSSGLHPISSHSCCMNVRAGRPAFDWPYAGVHRSTSLTISSLLLQQCPACLVCLACIVFVIGGRWPYSWHHVGCCCQDLFNIAHNILV